MNESGRHPSTRSLRSCDFAPAIEHHAEFVGRDWVFEAIEHWRASDPRPVLVLHGETGTGKSALAAELVRRNPGGAVLAYHFCRRDLAETLRPERFVTSLAAMLAHRSDAFAAAMHEPAVQDVLSPPRCQRAPAAAFDEGILAPLRNAAEGADAPRYLLIDALDAALRRGDQVVGTTLVDLLVGHLEQLPPTVRLIVTVADPRVVTDRLQSVEAESIDLGDGRSRHDLAQYLEARLTSEPLASALAAGGPPVESAIASLLEKTSANFLYAKQVLEAVERKQYGLDVMNDLPSCLDGLYGVLFDRRFVGEAGYAEPRSVLEILLAAREPLSEPQLAAATGWDDASRLDNVLQSLGTLVDAYGRDKAGRRWTLAHEALAGWLTDRNRCGAAYHADVRRGHERLADAGWREYERGPESLSDYARRHLGYHLAVLSRWDDLERFFTDPACLEALAEAGSAWDLARSLTEAVEALPGDRPGCRVVRLLDEAIRRDLPFLASHPDALFQCLWNTCWWYDCPQAPAHYVAPQASPSPLGRSASPQGPTLHERLEAWRTAKQSRSPGFAWVRSLRPPPTNLGAGRQAVLRGHERGVLAVAYSSDGRRIASGALDNTARLWDAESGTEVRCLRGHERGVRGVAFSPHGRRVATASLDRTIRIWETGSGNEVLCLAGHARDVTSVAFSPDGARLVSGSLDQTVRVWDAKTGAELLCLRGHEGPVFGVDFSPDGRRVVSGSKDRTVRVWDAETASQRHCLAAGAHDVTHVAYSPDGTRIFASSKDHTVRAWDAETGAELRCFRGHDRDVTGVACSPDGRRIVTGSSDQTVRVWDVQTGAELHRFDGHARDVTSVAYSPDGHGLASGSWDEAIRVWDAESTAELRALCGHDDWVRCLAYRPDGRQLASGSVDRTIRVWNAQNGTEMFALRAHTRDVVTLAYSPDGRRIASGAFDHTVRIWDAETGQELRCLHGHRSSVYSVAYSADGRRVTSGSLDQTVRVWDAETGQELRCLLGHDYWVLKAVFTPDGRRVVSAALDQTLRVWDVERGVELHCLRGHEMDVSSVACSPDGCRVASGSLDQTVRLWDVETGSELGCLHGHERGVTALAFSPDGRRIVSSSFDETVRIWDAQTGQCLEVIEGQGDVAAIADSGPRSAWRALAHAGQTVIAASGRHDPVARFPVALEQIVTHPDGRLWAGSQASHVYLIALEGPADPSGT